MVERRRLQTQRLKVLLGAVLCGVLASLVTGVVENPPEASIIGARYYGYPLVWRVTVTTIDNYNAFRFDSLAVDAAFWIVFFLLALNVLEKASIRKIWLPLILFVPLGLVMDFVHEFGHAVWGLSVGGRLSYMKIGYFEIYPQIALTTKFVLGYIEVEGLMTEFARGIFLLGGSMTTNIASWLLILTLLRTNLGSKTQVTLRILSLFGILDLPFYVIFPQIGLKHWIFLGGDTPEPLIGARKIGMPDPVFYILLVLTTLGLASLYFKPFWGKCRESLKLIINKKTDRLNMVSQMK